MRSRFVLAALALAIPLAIEVNPCFSRKGGLSIVSIRNLSSTVSMETEPNE